MKYWNALRYGSRETKLYLWAVLIGTVVTAGTVIRALMKASWTLGLVALFFAVVTLIIWQSRSLTDKDLAAEGEKKEKKAEPESRRKAGRFRKKEEAEPAAAKPDEEEKEEKEPEPNPDRPKSEKKQKGTAGDYSHYTAKSIERVLHHFRVRRIHRTVMIDSCESEGIYQCPAYLWKERKRVYLLVLEETPRKLVFPWAQMVNMTYERGVPADPKKEYESVKKPSLVNAVFAGFLPNYYEERVNSVTAYRKNLYRIGKDILVTNTSVPNVMETLRPSFRIVDEVTKEPSHGNYFVEMYQLNVLLRDGVLTGTEYKEQIKELLLNMAQDNMVFDEFRKAMEQMTEYRFITEEYAAYYMDYRKKWRQKNQRGGL